MDSKAKGPLRLRRMHLAGMFLSGLFVFVWACGSASPAASAEREPTHTPIPTNTPVPAVAEQVGDCEIGSGAECPGADFSGQDLGEIDQTMHGSEGRDAADFSEANLRGANFSDASLTGVDFTGADLRDANLRGASLKRSFLYKADLSGADLTDATLEQADLEDTLFEGAVFCNTKMYDGTKNNSDCP